MAAEVQEVMLEPQGLMQHLEQTTLEAVGVEDDGQIHHLLATEAQAAPASSFSNTPYPLKPCLCSKAPQRGNAPRV